MCRTYIIIFDVSERGLSILKNLSIYRSHIICMHAKVVNLLDLHGTIFLAWRAFSRDPSESPLTFSWWWEYTTSLFDGLLVLLKALVLLA